MKIGIFETDHFEGSYPKIRICDTGWNEITLIVNRNMETQLIQALGNRAQAFRWIVKENQESKREFISRLSHILPTLGLDILIFNTIADNFYFYATLLDKLPKTRVILHVHDLNNLFRPRFTLRPKRLFRFIGKKILLHKVDSVSVYEEAMVEYLREIIHFNRPVYWIPGSVYEPYSAANRVRGEANNLRVVIPGGIDKPRRDYELVLNVYESLRKNGIAVEFILLGSPCGIYGEHILHKCEVLRQRWGVGLEWYNDFVPIAEFDYQMSISDIVLMPLVHHITIFDGISETYGITKSSGGMSDMVKWAKPGIVPIGFKVAKKLESSVLRYKNEEDLVNLISIIHAKPDKIKNLSIFASENATHFTVQKLREKLSELIEDSKVSV